MASNPFEKEKKSSIRFRKIFVQEGCWRKYSIEHQPRGRAILAAGIQWDRRRYHVVKASQQVLNLNPIRVCRRSSGARVLYLFLTAVT